MKKLQHCDCHLKPVVSDATHMNLKVNAWGLRPIKFIATWMSEFVGQPSLFQRLATLIVSLHDQSTNLVVCSSIICFILLLILLQNVGVSGACRAFPCCKRLRQPPQSPQVARHATCFHLERSSQKLSVHSCPPNVSKAHDKSCLPIIMCFLITFNCWIWTIVYILIQPMPFWSIALVLPYHFRTMGTGEGLWATMKDCWATATNEIMTTTTLFVV